MKTQVLEVKGIVTKALPNAMYNAKIDKIEKEIVCYLCGKMNKRFIKPEIGDTVLIEMSPTDASKGRITRRF
jgi:translation initiation factor IF-1